MILIGLVVYLHESNQLHGLAIALLVALIAVPSVAVFGWQLLGSLGSATARPQLSSDAEMLNTTQLFADRGQRLTRFRIKQILSDFNRR